MNSKKKKNDKENRIVNYFLLVKSYNEETTTISELWRQTKCAQVFNNCI